METITRKEAEERIILSEKLWTHGLNFDPAILEGVDLENDYMAQSFLLFDFNHQTKKDIKLPAGFRLNKGTYTQIVWDRESDYHIIRENDKFFLTHKDEILHPLEFERRPAFYNKLTKNGTKMSTVGQYYGDGQLFIIYSNECSLIDQGYSCQFCNINATKNNFAERDNIQWKDAKQIAETTKAACDEGYKHLTISGGFIPERREVDYYMDIADEILDTLDPNANFALSACVGAPQDLNVIAKYKEAGYRGIATNLEIWDENIFKAICPGKDKLCGGHEHWLDVLREEVQVFGKGRVRSCLVAGLESKESLLEGVEYLCSIGVVPAVSAWNPNPGSVLELHRAPRDEWFHEVHERTYHLLKKYFTHEEVFYANASSSTIFDLYYELDGDHLPWFKNEPFQITD